jgi:hypothetical protein
MKSLTILIEELVGRATSQSIMSADGRGLERMRKQEGYTKIPDRYKPGRMIMGLSEEERETLKRAKPKDFYHRLFGK